VDVFALSFEHGAEKPDPRIFRAALDGLGTASGYALMVGDRHTHDGGAAALGVPTLVPPPLEHPGQRRLHLVEALVAAAPR